MQSADSFDELELLLSKIRRWCASSEHSSYEVMQRLQKLGYPQKEIKKALKILQKEGFVDDERYARAFARGKFKNLKWGRVKISAELQKKHLPSGLIQKALEEIDDEEYISVLRKLLKLKNKTLSGKEATAAKASLIRYALSKGFESSLIYNLVDGIFSNND